MLRSHKGFTMTEMIVSLLVVGIGIGLFNSLFISTWSAYEDRIKRANLWNETNQFFEQMTLEGRNSRLIDIVVTATDKTASFTNAADNKVTVFKIHDTGHLTRLKNAVLKTFSTNAVFADSHFTKNGKNLTVDLRLKEKVPTRDIHITASTDILLRN